MVLIYNKQFRILKHLTLYPRDTEPWNLLAQWSGITQTVKFPDTVALHRFYGKFRALCHLDICLKIWLGKNSFTCERHLWTTSKESWLNEKSFFWQNNQIIFYRTNWFRNMVDLQQISKLSGDFQISTSHILFSGW